MDQLAEALGAEPPRAVAALPARVRNRLAAQVEAAREREQATAEAAVEHALRGVPLPVRGVVKKALSS